MTTEFVLLSLERSGTHRLSQNMWQFRVIWSFSSSSSGVLSPQILLSTCHFLSLRVIRHMQLYFLAHLLCFTLTHHRGTPLKYTVYHVRKDISSFSIVSQHWDSTCSWNPSSWKAFTQLSCTINTIASDDLPGDVMSYDIMGHGIDLLASYQIRKIAGCTCAGNAGNVFRATDFKGNR